MAQAALKSTSSSSQMKGSFVAVPPEARYYELATTVGIDDWSSATGEAYTLNYVPMEGASNFAIVANGVNSASVNISPEFDFVGDAATYLKYHTSPGVDIAFMSGINTAAKGTGVFGNSGNAATVGWRPLQMGCKGIRLRRDATLTAITSLGVVVW